jgi:hypothetical protein
MHKAWPHGTRSVASVTVNRPSHSAPHLPDEGLAIIGAYQPRSSPRRSTLQPQFSQVHPPHNVKELGTRTGGSRAVQPGQTTAKGPRLVLPAKKYTTIITTTAIRTHAQRSIGSPRRDRSKQCHSFDLPTPKFGRAPRRQSMSGHNFPSFKRL